MLAQDGIVQLVDGDMTDASAGGKGGSGYRGERTKPARAHLAPACPTILEPEIVMMRKKRQAVARRERRELIGKNQIARKAQILRPDEGLSGWDCLPSIFSSAERIRRRITSGGDRCSDR